MPIILPTFQESSFFFNGEIPRHIEAYPAVPNYVGMFAVYCLVDGAKILPMAVDLETNVLAELVARARAAEQERTIGLYGYTDAVYINAPDGSNRQIYCGRTLGRPGDV